MRGFSLIEMMITVTIILVVSGIALMGLQPAMRTGRVVNGYNITLAAMRQARDYAVGQRQEYEISFSNAVVPNTITITQTGNGNVVATYQLPTDVTFQTPAGLPTAANAVPDGFGNGATPIDFDQTIAGGVKTAIYFMPDGTGQDVNGNINNGVIYIARAGDINSCHAITEWGTTGRLRGWHIYSNGGGPYWRED